MKAPIITDPGALKDRLEPAVQTVFFVFPVFMERIYIYKFSPFSDIL